MSEGTGDQAVGLVKGYHNNTVVPHHPKFDKRLSHRFAVVLYIDRSKPCIFNTDLFVRLIVEIAETVGGKRAEIHSQGSRYQSIGELVAAWGEMKREDRDTPDRVLLVGEDERIACWIEREDWGGANEPEHWYEAYSYGCYTHRDHSQTLRDACSKICAEEGVEVRFWREESPDPIRQKTKLPRYLWLTTVLGFTIGVALLGLLYSKWPLYSPSLPAPLAFSGRTTSVLLFGGGAVGISSFIVIFLAIMALRAKFIDVSIWILYLMLGVAICGALSVIAGSVTHVIANFSG